MGGLKKERKERKGGKISVCVRVREGSLDGEGRGREEEEYAGFDERCDIFFIKLDLIRLEEV